MLKVLFLFTYNQGFLSNFYQELCAMLTTDGFEVEVFYLKNNSESFMQDGVRYTGKPRRGYIHNYREVYRAIKASKPDIIVSNFSYINPALLFGKILQVPLNIAWVHTVYTHQKPPLHKVINKRLYLRLADKVITNSLQLKREMTTIYRVNKDIVTSIPFWTPICDLANEIGQVEAIHYRSSEFTIGCPGRLVKDKNHSVVIKALKNVIKGGYKAKVYIAGNGPYKSELVKLVEKLNLEQDVIFLGSLSSQEMVRFYQQMDVMVLPSLNESFGLVFIEASALGTPVIVSNKFGSLGFLDKQRYDVDNFTFDPTSPRELTEKLQQRIIGDALDGSFFKEMYEASFNKKIIYNTVRRVIEDK